MKLIEDIDCPHCKKQFTKETDLDKLDKADPIQTTNAALTGGTTQILEQKPVEKPEPKIETVIEDFKPNYECPNGNCDEGGIHRNTNHSKKVKGKCNNCDQFTKYDKGTCPWCEKEDTIESMDAEELEELGIKNPIDKSHEGHNHE